MKSKILFLGVLTLLLLLPAGVALAQGPDDGSGPGQVFTNQDFALKSGETFDGDLSVINGNLSMAEGSVVHGDVFVTRGSATVAGQVDGNLAVVAGESAFAGTGFVRGDVFALGGTHDLAGQVNGNVSILFGQTILRSSALIRGDLLVAPGDLTREEGAQVEGDVVTRLTIPPLLSGEKESGQLPKLAPSPQPRSPEWTPTPRPNPPVVTPSNQPGQRLERFAVRLLTALIWSVAVIILGALTVLIWPRPTQRVADCITAVPAQSFGLGLLTFLLAVGLEVVAAFLVVLVVLAGALLMATIILIPVGLLLMILSVLLLLPVPLALIGGVVLGWVGLAELIGRRLLSGLYAQGASPLAATLVGLVVTLIPAAVLWIIQPGCCGLPFVIVLTSIGLGSVFHTRFGTQGCQRERWPADAAVAPAGTTREDEVQPAPAVVDELPAEAMEQDKGQPDIPPALSP
jgi:hypothetical protein